MGESRSVCCSCRRAVDEVCRDGYCRDCHVSVSWDDCTTGTFQAKIMLANGHDRQRILELWPDANI